MGKQSIIICSPIKGEEDHALIEFCRIYLAKIQVDR
jgi:hypothetical protein